MHSSPPLPFFHASERDRVLSFLEAGDGSGPRIAFLVGPPTTGRTRTLREIGNGATERHPSLKVIAGTVKSGDFQASSRDPGWTFAGSNAVSDDLTTIIQWLTDQLALPSPVRLLVALIIQHAKQLLASLAEHRAARADPPLLTPILSAALAETPVLLLIDDLDGAGGGWCSHLLHDVLLSLSRSQRFWLAATLDGPEHPPSVASPGLSDAQYLVAVTQRYNPLWCHLRPVSRDDIVEQIGASVGGHLWAFTHGSLPVLDGLWDRWRAGRLIARDDAGTHHFVAAADRRVPMAMRDVALEELRMLLADAPLVTVDLALEVLATGAMEGEVFTSTVVAAALGIEQARVEELLNTSLCASATLLAGVVEDAGSVVTATQSGWCPSRRYRFASCFHWLVLRHVYVQSPGSDGRRRRIATAVSDAYGEDSQEAGRARYGLAGAECAREALDASNEEGRDPAVWRWRAGLVLSADSTVWTEADRARMARLLVNAAKITRGYVSFDEMASYCEEAVALALSGHDEQIEADARASLTLALLNQGRLSEALYQAGLARELYESQGNPSGGAHVATLQSDIVLGLGTPSETEARDEAKALLTLARLADNWSVAVDAHIRLARLDEYAEVTEPLLARALQLRSHE
jgi:hypothetical protein